LLQIILPIFEFLLNLEYFNFLIDQLDLNS
jgi:hypothetical protein